MPSADLVLRGGTVWDGRHRPGVSSVALAGGRVAAVGNDGDVGPMIGPETNVIDVGRRRIIPGLIDSHIHMVRAGLRWNQNVRWNEVDSVEEALGRVRHAASARPPGAWVPVLGGWHPDQFKERRPPTREELEAAAPRHPVLVQRNYIEGFLNLVAQEALDLPAESPVDPESGRVRGARALGAIAAQIPLPDPVARVGGTAEMIGEFNRLGLVGAIDAGGFGMNPDMYAAYTEMAAGDGRRFRLRTLVGAASPGDEGEQIERWIDLVQTSDEDEFLKNLGFGEVVLFGAHDMEGLAPIDISGQQAALSRILRRLIAVNRPIHIHAILDDSVTVILDAWEAATSHIDVSPLRSAITHGDQLSDANLGRIRDLGLGLTVQNGMAFRGQDSLATWGPHQVSLSPPLRHALDLGVPLAAGTDATVVSSYNPWVSLAWMVTGTPVHRGPRLDPSQRLSRDEALMLYTSGSAWFSGEEDSRGNLAVGSHADLAVLSRDFLSVDESDLAAIYSVLTIVAGQIVHLGPELESKN